MTRSIRAAVFCFGLLFCGYFLLFHVSAEREDPIEGLLHLPAPAPRNPLASAQTRVRQPSLRDKYHPPPDDAPIDELMDYWRLISLQKGRNSYSPTASSQ